MNNKKGFTMVELIAVIVIIGILATLIIPSVNVLKRKFRDDYYKKVEKNLVIAAKSYIADHKMYRPAEGQIKEMSSYMLQPYIGEVLDYRKKVCNYKVKVERKNSKFIYNAYLMCDDYTTPTTSSDGG